MPAPILYALGVLVFIAALFVSIAAHEWGHLYYAKKFGARVSQYMVGFGRTLWSRQVGETTYGIKAIPLGGFVKIIGMFPPATSDQAAIAQGVPLTGADTSGEPTFGDIAAQDKAAAPVRLRGSSTGLFTQVVSASRKAEFDLVTPADADRLFYKLPAHQRVMIMLAGPAINIAIAFVVLLGVYGIHGIQTLVPTGSTVITSVSQCLIGNAQTTPAPCTPDDPPTPAALSGLQVGDEVIAFNGTPVKTWEELSALIHANGQGPAQLEVLREGAPHLLAPVNTVLRLRDVSDALPGSGQEVYEQVGYLGVSPQVEQVTHRLGPVGTMNRMGQMTAHAISTIVDLPARVWNVALAVSGQQQRDPQGPMSVVGGSRVAGEVAASQIAGLDVGNKVAMLGLVIGSFNLFIGIFNLIPLLPLDGGHILGATWEGARRRLARIMNRPDPGPVDVAAQLPLAYGLMMVLIVMSVVLVVGDIVVPLRSGF